MDFTEFISNFAEALEIEDVSLLSGTTIFKELEEWTSLAMLDVIAMIDENYEVVVSPKEIRNISTLQELFEFIANK